MHSIPTVGKHCCGPDLTYNIYIGERCCQGYKDKEITYAVYNTKKTQICCAGIIQKGTQCCGNTAYDYKDKKSCCYVKQKNNQYAYEVFSRETLVCCGGKIQPGKYCCVDTPYSQGQGCCTGASCGIKSIYNRKTHACCQGEVLKGTGCCGNVAVDHTGRLFQNSGNKKQIWLHFCSIKERCISSKNNYIL